MALEQLRTVDKLRAGNERARRFLVPPHREALHVRDCFCPWVRCQVVACVVRVVNCVFGCVSSRAEPVNLNEAPLRGIY